MVLRFIRALLNNRRGASPLSLELSRTLCARCKAQDITRSANNVCSKIGTLTRYGIRSDVSVPESRCYGINPGPPHDIVWCTRIQKSSSRQRPLQTAGTTCRRFRRRRRRHRKVEFASRDLPLIIVTTLRVRRLVRGGSMMIGFHLSIHSFMHSPHSLNRFI